MALRWPVKDPDEVLDYQINWTTRLWSAAELAEYRAAIDANPALADADPSTVVMPADTIASSTFTLPSGTLVADSDEFTSVSTTVWLSGGVAGQSYLVQNRIVTAGGRTMDQTVKLKVKSK